jgi:hypothetical protein
MRSQRQRIVPAAAPHRRSHRPHGSLGRDGSVGIPDSGIDATLAEACCGLDHRGNRVRVGRLANETTSRERDLGSPRMDLETETDSRALRSRLKSWSAGAMIPPG